MMKPKTAMLPCPRCGFENPARLVHCAKCGISLEYASRPVDASEPALELVQRANATFDQLKVQSFLQQLREKQNLVLALAAGLVAAGVAAVLWAIITIVINRRIGWMAIGVGFLVGLAIRKFGQGVDKKFGVAGATLSLIGCLVGNLLAAIVLGAQQLDAPVLVVLLGLILSPDLILQVLIETFQPIDLLFYAIALYEGYRISFRTLSDAEMMSLRKPKPLPQ